MSEKDDSMSQPKRDFKVTTVYVVRYGQNFFVATINLYQLV